MAFGLPFKRTHTEFTGADVPRNANDRMGRMEWEPAQRVEIVKEWPGDDDRWQVRTVTGSMFVCDGDDLRPHPLDEQLNTEFVMQIMEGHNALTQAMVLQAIEQFAKAVLAAPKKAPEDDNGFVTDAAWRGSAQFILGQFVAKDFERQERDAKRAA